MNITLRQAALGLAGLCLAGFSQSTRAAGGEGWDWMIAPYVWAADIRTDLSVEAPPPGTGPDESGIIDMLDGAFMVHVEGQGDRFGTFADFTYFSLADDNDRPFSHTQSDLDARLFEAAAVWSPGDERNQGLGVFAGLRYIDLDLAVETDPVNPLFDTVTTDVGKSYSDFMIGARYTWNFTERWGMTLRGDGSFGDTEGTRNMSVVGHFRMNHGAWLFGYRYLSGELRTGDSEIEIAMKGLMIGYGFTL